MTSKIALRTSIVFQWLLVFATVFLSLFMEDYMPPQLRGWSDQNFDSMSQFSILVISVILAVILIFLFVGSVGLFLYKRWARWPYFIPTLALCALNIFTGPTVEHALTVTVSDLSMIVAGFIIGLAFFSDALAVDAFKKV